MSNEILAMEAHERRNKFVSIHGGSRLIEIKLLYEMWEKKDWDILGFDSFKDFVEASQTSGGLDISRSWANELIHNYAKYVVELGLPEETLIEISPRKLYYLKDNATEENVQEILGFAKETYLTQGSKLLFNSIHSSHSDFPLTTSKTLETLFKTSEAIDKNNILGTCCGLKFNHTQKGIIRIIMQQYFINNPNNQVPIRVISTIQDVTHLMKGDCYWFRAIYGDQHDKAILYRSQDNKTEPHTDILSQREKEILQLIAQGKETDDIAKKLTISRNTVNNHRQNMLDKICAKDTTALIELARICHLI